MEGLKHPVLPADSGAVDIDLIDVLSVPTVGAAVLSRLQGSSKAGLRQSCSALCSLVRRFLARGFLLDFCWI
jgi:hypothetical protein